MILGLPTHTEIGMTFATGCNQRHDVFVSIRVVNARTLAPRTTQQLAGSSDRSSWMAIYCHGAVIKPTAMNTKPSEVQWMYIDGSQRETSV